MTGSKYLTIIAVALTAAIGITAAVSCDTITDIAATTKEQAASLGIGTVKGIYVGPETPYDAFSWLRHDERHYFFVLVEPTNAEASRTYIVSLYVEGQLRQKNHLSWNQAELNVNTAKYVLFDLITEDEWQAYSPEHFLPPSPDLPQNLLTEIQSNYPTKSLSPSICNATITLEPIFELEGLSIEPQQASVEQPIIIKIAVVNNGDKSGEYNAVLKINGQVVQTAVVTVCGKLNQCINRKVVIFTVNDTEYTRIQPGTYIVDIGGQKGSFTIK
jgi:hypothetical protein